MTIRSLALLTTLALGPAALAFDKPTVEVMTAMPAGGPSGYVVRYAVDTPYDCKTPSFDGVTCDDDLEAHAIVVDANGAILADVTTPASGLYDAPSSTLPAGPDRWLLRDWNGGSFLDTTGAITPAAWALGFVDDNADVTWSPVSDGWWRAESNLGAGWVLVHTLFDGSDSVGNTIPVSDDASPQPSVCAGSTQVLTAWSDGNGAHAQRFDFSAKPIGKPFPLESAYDYESALKIVATDTGFLVRRDTSTGPALYFVDLDGTVTAKPVPTPRTDDQGVTELEPTPTGALFIDAVGNYDGGNAPLTVVALDATGNALESPRVVAQVAPFQFHMAAGASGFIGADVQGTDVRIQRFSIDGAYVADEVVRNPGPGGCSVGGRAGSPVVSLLLVALFVVCAIRAARARART